jgi:hypothetical protein
MADHYHRRSPSNPRSLGPFSSSSYNNPYPGINSLGDIPQLEASAITPYQGGGLNGSGSSEWIAPSAVATTTVIPGAVAAKTGGFSLANLGELKGVIDRMGGIDGIVSSMGKFQKVMTGVQQMAPMIKLMMGSFGKGKTKGTSEEGDGLYYTPTKRRRKKSSTTKRKQTSRRYPTKQVTKRSTYKKLKKS